MVPTAMDLGGKYAKRNQQQRKKIAEDVLEGETGKRETEEIIYNIETLRRKHKPRILKKGAGNVESGMNLGVSTNVYTEMCLK